jgi:hypothetical protein
MELWGVDRFRLQQPGRELALEWSRAADGEWELTVTRARTSHDLRDAAQWARLLAATRRAGKRSKVSEAARREAVVRIRELKDEGRSYEQIDALFERTIGTSRRWDQYFLKKGE